MNEATYWRQRYEMLMANFADALEAARLPPPPIMLADKESYEAGRIAGMAAQRKPWMGLTDDEIGRCLDAADGSMGRLIAAIEAKLKEKNS